MAEYIRNQDILFVSRTWTQRGINNDIHHYLNWFPGAKIMTNQHAWTRPHSLLKWIADKPGREGYGRLSLGIEAATMMSMIRFRPKITHFIYADHEYQYSWLASGISGSKLAGTFYFSVEEYERRIPDKRHFKKLDLILASGREQMEYLSKFVPSDKLALFPLGVDTEFYCPPANPTRRREAAILLHVGYNRRDFHTLKSVYLKLKEKIPKVSLQLVGGMEARNQLEDLPDVFFHPFLSDSELREVYHKATVLLLPLLEGASSQTLNEAMSTGLPVVTNSLPNLDDYLRDTGIPTAAVGDSKSLAACCEILLTNPTHWTQVSSRCRAASLHIDFAKCRERLVSIYKDKFNYEVQEAA